MLLSTLFLVAQAFRKFQGESEVRDMLTILLEKCFQVCTTDEETTDSKAAFLPSFLQSLASIIKETSMVSHRLFYYWMRKPIMRT